MEVKYEDIGSLYTGIGVLHATKRTGQEWQEDRRKKGYPLVMSILGGKYRILQIEVHKGKGHIQKRVGKKKWEYVKTRIDKNGYNTVVLYYKGKRYLRSVAYLIYSTCAKRYPRLLSEGQKWNDRYKVYHRDGNKADDNFDNLYRKGDSNIREENGDI